MASLYRLDYEGTASLERLDTYSTLCRWFHNYKLDRSAEFADDHEWLTIEEKKFRAARRLSVRYVGTICDVEERGPRRTVLFETNAPPPPTFHRPAKFRPERKPTRAHDGGTLTADMLLETMDRIGLSRDRCRDLMINSRNIWELAEQVHREKYRYELERTKLNAMNWIIPIYSRDLILSIDLVNPIPQKPSVPPPKRYWRN